MIRVDNQRLNWLLESQPAKDFKPRNPYRKGDIKIPIHMLASYAYWGKRDMVDVKKKLEILTGARAYIIADSGAFSITRIGKAFSLEEYAEWGLKYQGVIDRFINLDVIYDAKLSQRNWERLKKRGLKTIPVFHVGSDLAILNELANEHDLICLGGVAGQKKGVETYGYWYKKCFETVGDRAKLHALGISSNEFCYRFPFDSFDSSSVSTMARHNFIIYTNRWGKIARCAKHRLTNPALTMMMKDNIYIHDLIAMKKRAGSHFRVALGLYYYTKFAALAGRYWERRGFNKPKILHAFGGWDPWKFVDIIREFKWNLDCFADVR